MCSGDDELVFCHPEGSPLDHKRYA
jgi:hypothetical protein